MVVAHPDPRVRARVLASLPRLHDLRDDTQECRRFQVEGIRLKEEDGVGLPLRHRANDVVSFKSQPGAAVVLGLEHWRAIFELFVVLGSKGAHHCLLVKDGERRVSWHY